jgi:hypothetical protein
MNQPKDHLCHKCNYKGNVEGLNAHLVLGHGTGIAPSKHIPKNDLVSINNEKDTSQEGETYNGVADLIASKFHAAYEELAPHHGYNTRKESAVAWRDVPDNNRSLMQATVQKLLDDKVISVPFSIKSAIEDSPEIMLQNMIDLLNNEWPLKVACEQCDALRSMKPDFGEGIICGQHYTFHVTDTDNEKLTLVDKELDHYSEQADILGEAYDYGNHKLLDGCLVPLLERINALLEESYQRGKRDEAAEATNPITKKESK